MLTYSEAQALMESARDQSRGKPLANNTRLYNRGPRLLRRKKDGTPVYEKGDTFAVELHCTDVVEIHPDGTYTLNTGGWDAVTTWQRINQYTPHHGGQRIYDRKLGGGKRFLLGPNPDDPAPTVTPRRIPPVFQMPDPGPEPVKSSEGCVAGQTHTWVERELTPIYVWHASDRIKPGDRPSLYDSEWEKVNNAPNRAASVVAYLDAFFSKYGFSMHVDREFSVVITYVEEGDHWALNNSDVIGQAMQCQHCKEFDERHRQWDRIMRGYHNRKVGIDCGYALRAEMLEEFGTETAWKEAALEDHRRLKAEREAWREWAERNTVKMYDGLIIDSYGYADRKAAERAKRLQRAEEREAAKRQRAYERERIRREKEQAEKDRLARIEAERIEAELRESMGVDYQTEPGAITWLAENNIEVNNV